MNKKFYGTLLLGTLLLGSTIVSCKDYDDDIDNLQNQITQLATKADMQSEVSKLQSAVATAQAAAENKAAAAEQAAKDAAAKAQAAADAAAKAQGTADAAATVEALNKVAAEAAAAAQAADEAKAAAEAKAAELEAQLAELQALAATLVSTEDFEAAKKELNDKYAELAAKIGETTGVTGMTGINLVGDSKIAAGYGVWAGVHNNMKAAEWDGPKAKEINAIEKSTKLAAWGVEGITFSVNPTDFDASKIESFAVVNQFDEVAPIAFGAPKAVTRAAAGAWTLPVLGNVIYGEKAVEFEKNFNKNANNQDGSVATLVAGQFAGVLKAEFCKVTPNVNASQTTFSKTIAIDEIDGTAVLGADDASVVLDAYITKITDTFNGNVAHDSVVYKLAYTGTTLTYDAEAVKKFMSTQEKDCTIKVKVKQINLNGYIHTAVGTITFKAKEGAGKPIVLERIELDPEPHTIVPIVWNKSKGENDDNQHVIVSILPALKEWGIDLSKTKEEATIHWNHTDFKDGVEVIADSVYYLSTDQTPVYLTGFAGAELIEGAEKDKNKNSVLKLKFTEDYKYNNVKNPNNAVDKDGNGIISNSEDGIDAAFNGKLIYVPVKMTGTDTDNGVKKTVVYSVVVPVQFGKINITDYYKWNKGNAVRIQVASGATPGNKLIVSPTSASASCSFDNIYTSKDNAGALVSLAKPTFQGKKANGTNTNNPAEVKYVVPSVTVSGQTGAAYLMAIEDRRKEGYTTASAVIENNIKYAYMNAVTVTLGTSTTTIEPKWLKVATDTYNWALEDGTTPGTASVTAPTAGTYSEDVTLNIAQPSLTTTQTASTSTYNGIKYMNLLKNAKYKISGIACAIMGRTVRLGDLEVEVYTAPTSAYTVELSDNKIFNDPTAPTMYFANEAYAPVGEFAAKFSKTFSVTNKYGAFEVSTAHTITPEYVQYVFADGSVTPISSGIYGSRITVISEAYEIDEKTTPTEKNGLTFKVASVPTSLNDEDGNSHEPAEIVKIRVTLPKTEFKMVSDNTVVPAEDITFEFEVSK